MKKSTILIGTGILNTLHGLFHIIQFIQSMFLLTYSVEHHNDTWIESVMHNPIFSVLWATVGIATLIIGIRDYRHHKKCKDNGKCDHNH